PSEEMKQITKYLTTSIFFVVGVVLIYFVYRQFPLKTVLETFNKATPFPVILFITVSLVIMILQAWRWDVILKTAKVKVPFHKVFLYKIVGFGISFITPFAKVGGEPLRAGLLAKHDCSFEKGMSTVVIDKIIDLAATGFMFALGVFVALNHLMVPESLKIVLIIISLVFLGMIARVYYQLLNNKTMVVRLFKMFRLHKIPKLKRFENALASVDRRIIDFHKKETRAFYKTVAISVAAWLLMFVEYKSVLWIFGYDLTILQLFTIITIMGAAYIFPIPLALGIFEFGQAQTFSMLGLKAAAGIGLSIIIRARDLMWTVFGIIILLAHGKSFKKAYMTTVKQTKLPTQ
ncbi:MAG: flippase-like domain-containing protein, partial [Nanoarchaeota archaeon]|nr:flippase-like domain-containing protein [Nanoarchaeota archaeon]